MLEKLFSLLILERSLKKLENDLEALEGESPDFTTAPPTALSRSVQKDVSVDNSVFYKYGIAFIYNLVEVYDTLQLNFELKNTRSLVAALAEDEDFTIKANVYNKRGKLLSIEEISIDQRQLKSNYAADYFYFSDVSVGSVHSIRIYAIAPDSDPPYEESSPQAGEAPNAAPCENTEYIYCSVSFYPGGKTYYYKTTDDTLQCGDEVIVPVGNSEKKEIATIVCIEKFSAAKAPYPLALTRDILGKYPY